MLFNKTNLEILEELDSRVYGHMFAKKSLISLINRSKVRHYQKWIQKIHKDHLVKPSKCLLVGQSGTGKTHLLESLAEICLFPLIRIDATKLNPTGASGGIKEEEMRKMIYQKAEHLCSCSPGYYFSVEGVIDQMVIFIDEIDKLGKAFDSSGNWNSHTQSNFLTLFDNKQEFAGLSFIFAGAFTDITKNKDGKKSIGFTSNKSDNDNHDIDEKVVNSGLLPELVGRINNIVELDSFSVEDYKHILTTRLIPQKRVDVSYFNIYDVDISDERATKMAEIAYRSGQGIRSLQRQLDKQFIESEFEYELNRYPLLENTSEPDYDY